MTQNEKDLLLKDLCGRIMYGVKCTVYEDASVYTLSGVLPYNVYKELYFRELDWKEYDGFADVQYCKPYIFPLSSMTEEEKSQYSFFLTRIIDGYDASLLINWLDAHHFDYRSLISIGLAINATGLDIY